MGILWQSTVVKALTLGAKCFDLLIWIAGPLFISLAVLLIGGCIGLYFGAVVPYIFSEESSSVLYWLNMVFSIWIVANIGFNYFACVFTSPGSPRPLSAEDGLNVEKSGAKICKKCNAPKPERAHHCSVCKRCVYKMDHHCPWMHNCVGHHNHRYFFLFLAYLWLGCLYFCALTSIPFMESSAMSHRKWNALHSGVPKAAVSFAFVLAAAICCSLTLLVSWNLYLILSAQTTVEFYTNRYMAKEMKLKGVVFVNDYDLGTATNFKHFFNIGKYPWWTILLPMRVPGAGDGTSFPTFRSKSWDV